MSKTSRSETFDLTECCNRFAGLKEITEDGIVEECEGCGKEDPDTRTLDADLAQEAWEAGS